VVKASEEIDLCPDAGFVSLSFFLDNLEGDLVGWMDETEDVVAGSERDYRDWKRAGVRVVWRNMCGRVWHELVSVGWLMASM